MKADFKIFLLAEQKVELQTYEQFEKWFVLFAQSIDALIALSYVECHHDSDFESNDYLFYLYVKRSYMQAPFSFESVRVLMSKGQYLEAVNLCRSIIENLVNCKYLLHHKEDARKTLTGDTFKIQDRWNTIEENAYNKIYKLLCKIEHKNFGHSGSQAELNARLLSVKELTLLPVFERSQADFIINYTLFLLYGYLNLFSSFFIYNHNEVEPMVASTIEQLKHQLAKQKDAFPESKKWRLMMEKIVNKESI